MAYDAVKTSEEGMPLVLRKDTDFAIQLLVFYAKKRQAGDEFVYRREVLHTTRLNTEPQTRICRLLAGKGLLETTPCGRSVGYRLAVPPEEITLKQVIEIMESSTELIVTGDRNQSIYNTAAWKRLQSKFENNLDSVTIGQLAGK